MARQKKPVDRVQMTEGKRNIIHQLLEEVRYPVCRRHSGCAQGSFRRHH